jgi:hypothetical protein
VDSRLRGAARLVDARRMPGGARVRVLITAEIEGATKPACLAEQILAFYG